MAIITRRITNNLDYSFTIPCPGENNDPTANLIIPASVVNLDLLALCTEDILWILQPALLSLERAGAISVTETIDTASFEAGYTGGSGGVGTLNGLIGSVTLAPGANVTLTPLGNTITIAATGGTPTVYTGTADEVIVTGTVLSTPQAIATISNPTFNGVNLTSYIAVGSPFSSNGQIQLFNNSNGNYVDIISGVTSANYLLYLPNDQGAANTFLENDGTGHLSWAASSGVSTLNTLAGAVTLTAGSNVTLTSSGPNDVTINAVGGGSPAAPDTSVQFNNGGSFGGTSDLTWDGSTLTVNGLGVTATSLTFINSLGSQNANFTVNGNGDILTSGTLSMSGLSTLNADGSASFGNGEVTISGAGIVNLGPLSSDNGAFLTDGSGGLTLTGPLNVAGGNFVVDTGGGITTTATIQTAGFQLSTSPIAGYVLTSDATGTGTWAPAPVPPSTAPALPVNSVQFNNAGSFGGSANLTWATSSIASHTALIINNTPGAGGALLQLQGDPSTNQQSGIVFATNDGVDRKSVV